MQTLIQFTREHLLLVIVCCVAIFGGLLAWAIILGGSRRQYDEPLEPGWDRPPADRDQDAQDVFDARADGCHEEKPRQDYIKP